MTGDVLDRLTAIDPATDGRVHEGIAELGDLPARIAGEGAATDGLAPRRRLDRRQLITVLVAALVALAVLIPIAVLRGLGDDGTAVGTSPSDPTPSPTPTLTHGPAAIVVESPPPEAVVTSPVRIAGTADVFEANVRIQILDEGGDVLADTFTTATCGTGCRGDYSADVPFSVSTEQNGTILVFEESAEDGSMINIQEIPVVLATQIPPSTIPAPIAHGPIRVAEPLAGDSATSPVTIAGTADVFEAVVSIKIVADDGTVLADTTTMASCGTGCRGDFSARVRFTVAAQTAATIMVFEVSAKDGSPIHVVRIPVTLAP